MFTMACYCGCCCCLVDWYHCKEQRLKGKEEMALRDEHMDKLGNFPMKRDMKI